MNDVDTTQSTELAAEADRINGARAGEIEEHRIATTNDQISEHEAEIQAAEAAIEHYQDEIKRLRKDIRRRQRAQDKLRQRRAIFADAAHALRMTEYP